MTHKSAIRKGSNNVIDFAAMRANREAPKAVKPKRSKAARMATSADIARRYPGSYADKIASVGMR
jgi:hypothetical protein